MTRRLIWVPLLASAFACAEADDDLRTAYIATTLAEAEITLLRTRPALMEGKFARMARGLYDFYRGTVPVFAADFANGELSASRTRFAADDVFVLSMGDAHPENFGLLLAADGSLAVEPNDFDSADLYPYHWDLRRLTVGLVLAVWLANPDDEPSAVGAPVVAAAAAAYLAEMERQADGLTRFRVGDAAGSVHYEDLFQRGQRDLTGRRELSVLTRVEAGSRRFVRGPDPEDPETVWLDLPEFAVEALPAALDRYRSSLLAPPPAEYFRLKDAVRELGTGVASWARIRLQLLIEGPTDDPGDDVVIEMKELIDSATAAWRPPARFYRSVQERIIQTAHALWSRPDAEPLWGATFWLGLPVQVRLESDAQKNLRVRRMIGNPRRGDPGNIEVLADRLGRMLARNHATPNAVTAEPAQRLAAIFTEDREAFVEGEVAAAIDYAAVVATDWPRFRRLVGRDPMLGVRPRLTDQPRPEVEAVLGNPPPAQFPDLLE